MAYGRNSSSVLGSTCADELLRGGKCEGPTDVQADGWIEHPTARRYTLKEDSRYIGNGLVLSLLWWKDECQLLDLRRMSINNSLTV